MPAALAAIDPTDTYRRKDGVYQIVERLPFVLEGTRLFTNNATGAQQFGAFTNSAKMPFEMVRMVPTVTMFDDSIPSVSIEPLLHANIPPIRLMHLLRVNINDLYSGQTFTQHPATLAALVNKATLAWEFDAPHYLEVGQNMLVSVQNIAPTTFSTGTAGGGFGPATCTGLQLHLVFEGALLVLGERVA